LQGKRVEGEIAVFDKLVTKAQNFVADVVAWRINRHMERVATKLLEQVHLGASLEWVAELVEIRGRHALVVAHH
jgi:hypothetical protein